MGMLYDIFYADNCFDSNASRMPKNLKNAVVRNTNGDEGTVLIDRYGKEWSGRQPIPATRLTKAGRKLAETWHFAVV